jgi:hypothetical protein
MARGVGADSREGKWQWSHSSIMYAMVKLISIMVISGG